jgi:hypothetical protein
MEEKRPIQDFPGYEISRDKQVYRNGRLIAQSEKSGKKRVQLTKNGRKTSRTIERLMFEVWGQ